VRIEAAQITLTTVFMRSPVQQTPILHRRGDHGEPDRTAPAV
jgi:hypothetical protein